MRRHFRRRVALGLITIVVISLGLTMGLSYQDWYYSRIEHLKVLCESKGLRPLEYYYGHSLSFCENEQGMIFHIDEPKVKE